MTDFEFHYRLAGVISLIFFIGFGLFWYFFVE